MVVVGLGLWNCSVMVLDYVCWHSTDGSLLLFVAKLTFSVVKAT